MKQGTGKIALHWIVSLVVVLGIMVLWTQTARATTFDSADSLKTGLEGNGYDDNLVIDKDFTINGNVTIKAGRGIRLNGHTLTINGALTIESGTYVDNFSKKLIIREDSGYSGGRLVCTGGITVNGELNLLGGTITGASNASNGAVYVNGGSFSMTGGTISNNTGTTAGGVYVGNNGAFTMSGGTISGNEGSTVGGVYVAQTGTFNLSGGTISNRSGTYAQDIYSAAGSMFNLSGGTVNGPIGLEDNAQYQENAIHVTGSLGENVYGVIKYYKDGNISVYPNGTVVDLSSGYADISNFTSAMEGYVLDKPSMREKLIFIEHETHNWVISLSDDGTTAAIYCQPVGCEYHAASTVTISAEDTPYTTGDEVAATIARQYGPVPTVEINVSEITYTKKNAAGTAYESMTGVPRDVGEYCASATVSVGSASGTINRYYGIYRDPVPYLDWNGSALELQDGNNACRYYNVVSSGDTSWTTGWYVVNQDVSISSRINVYGMVHLILCDGAKLTAPNGIHVGTDNSLIIHGQTTNSGTLEATGGNNGAGIGGDNGGGGGGNITINGGTVNATGVNGAGIGGGDNNSSGPITVNGGIITATSTNGAGIGGGWDHYNYNDWYAYTGGSFTVRGGKVTAIGGECAISKEINNAIPGTGWTNAEGTEGKAEIGTDSNQSFIAYKKVQFPALTSYGVWVGGVEVTSENDSGTGWSYDYDTQTLTLNGYSYTGTGYKFSERYYAAIYATHALNINFTGTNSVVNNGDPRDGQTYGIFVYEGGNLTISGTGTLTAEGLMAIATNAGYDVIINSGTVIATGKDAGSNGINPGKDLFINGGTVTATGDFSIIATNIEIKEGAKVTSSGSSQAIYGTVKNEIPGTGWTDVDGTAGETGIPVSGEEGQYLPDYKKVQFLVPTVDVTGVSLDMGSVTLTEGDTQTLTAAVSPENATDQSVIWSVGGTDAGAVKLYTDAECNTEVGDGATSTLIVYAKGISAGSATVTVTSNADANKTASCAIEVVKPKLTLILKLAGAEYGSYKVSVGGQETTLSENGSMPIEVEADERVTVTFLPTEYGELASCYLDNFSDEDEYHLENSIENNSCSFTVPADLTWLNVHFAYKGVVETVGYVDELGEPHSVEATILTGYEPIEYYDHSYRVLLGEDNTDTWYAVKSNVTYSKEADTHLDLRGDVHLIAADGATLTVKNSIRNGSYYDVTDTLSVYGQANQTGTVSAGTVDCDTLNLCGGNLTAGAVCDTNDTVNIKGGALTVSGNVEAGVLDISGGVTNITGEARIRNLTLGCRSLDDRITVGTYVNDGEGTKKYADGQLLTDGTYLYSGLIYDNTFPHGKTLQLAEMVTLTVVMPDEPPIAVEVAKKQYIGDLKQKIADVTGIPAYAQILKLGEATLDDRTSVESNNLNAQSSITLLLGTVAVTFDSNSGSLVAEQDVTYGETAARPADPAREGYVLQGWYQIVDETGALSENAFDFTTAITESITLKAVWKGLWADLQDQIDAAESDAVITLKGNTTALDGDSRILIPEGKTVTIDLNGHDLNRNLTDAVANGNVIVVRGTLTIRGEGRITGGNTLGNGGGISVGEYGYWQGALNLEGGTVTGNNARQGGGIFVCAEVGPLNMTGGTVTGNTATNMGGGVYISEGNQSQGGWSVPGVMNISGSPVITGNTVDGEPNNLGIGTQPKYTTCVHVTGELSDTASIGITTSQAPTAEAPVVFTDGLNGKGTTASFRSDDPHYPLMTNADGEAMLGAAGIVVFFEPGYETDETMESVLVDPSAAYKYDLPECGFSGPEGKTFAGWKYIFNGQTYILHPGTNNGNVPTNAGDVTVTAAWTNAWSELQDQINSAADGATITLTEDITAAPSDTYLTVPGDSNIAIDLNGHTLDRGLKGAEARSDGSVIHMISGSGLTITDDAGGGKITGGNSSYYGGGITVMSGGTLTLNGGAITGNTTETNGGGVYLEYEARLIMNGGSITGNIAQAGGGVYAKSGTNNPQINATEVRIKGSPVVTGNTGGNVYLDDGDHPPIITVTGALAADAVIGVTTEKKPTAEAPVVITSGLEDNGTAASFLSDDPQCLVEMNANGEAELIKAFIVTFDSDGGSEVTAQIVANDANATRPDDPARQGFYLLDWYQVLDAGEGTLAETAFDFENTAITGNITLKAVWDAIPDFGTPDFVIPASTVSIKDNAFEGIAATIVVIPTGCASIGAEAFKDCAELTRIRIPANCTVGEDAFDGCVKVFIFGAVSSSAESYCRSHDNCVFVAEGQN